MTKEILHKEFAFQALITPSDEKFREFFESQKFKDMMAVLNRRCVESVIKAK